MYVLVTGVTGVVLRRTCFRRLEGMFKGLQN